jgi:hypothetical protein
MPGVSGLLSVVGVLAGPRAPARCDRGPSQAAAGAARDRPPPRQTTESGSRVNPPVPLVAGAAVILTGEWLNTTRQALLIAARARKHNGLPVSSADQAVFEALTRAMAAHGQSDVPEPPGLQDYPQTDPTVPNEDAARQLGLSLRQTRRLAPKLGGKIINGRWLLDQTAIDEHVAGGNRWKETA